MDEAALDELIGRRIRLPGHFVEAVKLEGVRRIYDGAVEVRVRTASGSLQETILTEDQLASIEPVDQAQQIVDAARFFDFVEAHRIQLAYAHDPYFAVSMTGIRGLPHQITAVYKHMLPQTRLRFVLADDPGAGKTIMAGLLMKELQLRGVADRVLVLCPAPLTPQWQAELAEKFDEHFELYDSRIKWTLGDNPWQRHNRIVTSIDFAKREEVMKDLLRADWDLVVIDEAHKCAATTRTRGNGQREELDRTQRYRLAEQISAGSERLLLMTATPHSGDRSRFENFLKLLDPDQFAVAHLAREQITTEDSPYFLRRQKEDLKDEKGAPLFVPREVVTQPFKLTEPELRLYEEVTAYIREFLGHQPGRKGTAVALARTVLQRRLASSLGAIHSSLKKRAARIAGRVEEIEATPPAERTKKLAELRLVPDFEDDELDPDDATEESEEAAAEGVVVAETLDHMRAEIVELERLVALAQKTIEAGEEAKLTALRECLESAQLAEVRDGRGKLLIFSEHRDTLDYLVKNLTEWGYAVCSIHGGDPPIRRREIQQDFRLNKQICVATEAAGEGINLQFCHLMINYDLPWNPVRLEQRMGRIHRIGQEAKCWVFNFCAENTVEGKLLLRLLKKLEQMEKDLGGRVYDIVGEVLERGGVNFEGLLREALLNPERMDEGQLEIEGLDAAGLWGYPISGPDASEVAEVLRTVSDDLGEKAERRSEPDVILSWEDLLVIVEAKFHSGNESKDASYRGWDLYLGNPELFSVPDETVRRSGWYELVRNWVIGTRITTKLDLEKFALVNLGPSQLASDCEQLSGVISQTSARSLKHVTWERLLADLDLPHWLSDYIDEKELRRK